MDREERGSSRGSRRISVEEILVKDLLQNAGQSGVKLKELLNGSILVRCTDSGKRYLIDWTKPEMSSKSVDAEATADCTISLSEENLRRIAEGELNPQIAMLSDKVSVDGKKGAAMYLFNLIAPRIF